MTVSGVRGEDGRKVSQQRQMAGIRVCPQPPPYIVNVEPLPRFGAGDLTDDGIDRVLRQYARAIEDGADPKLYAPMIRTCRAVKLVRLTLRMRYGAQFDGTYHYDEYMRLGAAPTYWLALNIDRFRWQRGLSHVLDGRVKAGVSDRVIRWAEDSAA